MIKFLDLPKQYRSMKREIDRAILSVVSEGAFIGGRPLTDFEAAFAKYTGAKCCIGVGNGTDAIEIILEGLNLPAGSEVIVPANSFIATSEAVTRSGLKVVFCDCDPDNYTISIKDAERRITSRTKAVIAVHLYGHPCDMNALTRLARRHKLSLIEDCAQAHGSEFRGRRVGTFGVAAAFSFYPGKNLGAYGDAGAIITNNPRLAEKVRMIANHGRLAKYDHAFEGRNSRLDSLQAAVLTVKLSRLDKFNRIRRSIAECYLCELAGCKDIVLPKKEKWANPVWHLFVIRLEKRDALKDYLQKNGVQTGVHYPVSLPRLKAYSYLSKKRPKLVADEYCDKILSLPMGDHMTLRDAHTVSRLVKKFLASGPY